MKWFGKTLAVSVFRQKDIDNFTSLFTFRCRSVRSSAGFNRFPATIVNTSPHGADETGFLCTRDSGSPVLGTVTGRPFACAFGRATADTRVDAAPTTASRNWNNRKSHKSDGDKLETDVGFFPLRTVFFFHSSPSRRGDDNNYRYLSRNNGNWDSCTCPTTMCDVSAVCSKY